ncbi:hypothetical protein M5689_010938 [Euphorbia peplus]|nr:hypothetical protein M5689_010938 [Euphorbia peplus]
MASTGNNEDPTTEGLTKSQRGNVRQKNDPTWTYASEGVNSAGKKVLICSFCQKEFAGGGINHVKQHLTGAKGESYICKKVSADVRFLLQGSLKQIRENANEKKRARQGIEEDIDVQIDDIASCPSKNVVSGFISKSKMKAAEITSFFKTGTQDPKQPTIRACMQSKEK